jgi:putative endonuclease
MFDEEHWWVYVLKSDERGCTYVGCTNDPERRLREHREGRGASFTASASDWTPEALYGPYDGRSEAQKAEHALKKKTGQGRMKWSKEDSDLKRGKGESHPWVSSYDDTI